MERPRGARHFEARLSMASGRQTLHGSALNVSARLPPALFVRLLGGPLALQQVPSQRARRNIVYQRLEGFAGPDGKQLYECRKALDLLQRVALGPSERLPVRARRTPWGKPVV